MILLSNTERVVLCHMIDMIIIWTWTIYFGHKENFKTLDIKDKCFTLWGLSFKPNTDDMREAPSLTLIELLTAAGARVQGYDPEANEAARRLFAENTLFSVATDRRSALKGSDGLILVTEWNEFRSPDFQTIRNELSEPVIFDGRNLYEPGLLNQLGFTYYGIGRGS